ncbi:hypothetical protein EKK58_06335 [Candidatus Dependentiae bacterium]|nr:MAG: hypothetical protein EKK58_06335 [Candidatus Dependentiae bacterium]
MLILNKNIFLFIFLTATSHNTFTMISQYCPLLRLPIEIQKLIYTFIQTNIKGKQIRLTQTNKILDGQATPILELKIKIPPQSLTKTHVISKKRKRTSEKKELVFSVEASSCKETNCDVCYPSTAPTRNKVIRCALSENKQTATCCFDDYQLTGTEEKHYTIGHKTFGQGNIQKELANETDPFFTFSDEEIKLIENADNGYYDGNPLRAYFHETTVCKNISM